MNTKLTLLAVIEILSALSMGIFILAATYQLLKYKLAFTFIGTGAIYIGTAFILGAIICVTGIVVYTYLTPVDEFAELKNNNVAVALVVGSIIITLSLLTKDGVALLLESFIPYPEQYPGR
jgi:hypothetical protein